MSNFESSDNQLLIDRIIAERDGCRAALEVARDALTASDLLKLNEIINPIVKDAIQQIDNILKGGK